MSANVSGTVLASLFYEHVNSSGDQEGLLLGRITRQVKDSISDSQMSNVKVETFINVYSYVPCSGNSRLLDLNAQLSRDMLSQVTDGNIADVVGWYRFRRGSTARLSMKEKSLHYRVLGLLPDLTPEHFLVLLLTSAPADNLAVHTFDHSFLSIIKGHFKPMPLTVINLGDTTLSSNYKTVPNSTFHPEHGAFPTLVQKFSNEFNDQSGQSAQVTKVKCLNYNLQQHVQNLCAIVSGSEHELCFLETEVDEIKHRLHEEIQVKRQQQALPPTPMDTDQEILQHVPPGLITRMDSSPPPPYPGRKSSSPEVVAATTTTAEVTSQAEWQNPPEPQSPQPMEDVVNLIDLADESSSNKNKSTADIGRETAAKSRPVFLPPSTEACLLLNEKTTNPPVGVSVEQHSGLRVQPVKLPTAGAAPKQYTSKQKSKNADEMRTRTRNPKLAANFAAQNEVVSQDKDERTGDRKLDPDRGPVKESDQFAFIETVMNQAKEAPPTSPVVKVKTSRHRRSRHQDSVHMAMMDTNSSNSACHSKTESASRSINVAHAGGPAKTELNDIHINSAMSNTVSDAKDIDKASAKDIGKANAKDIDKVNAEKNEKSKLKMKSRSRSRSIEQAEDCSGAIFPKSRSKEDKSDINEELQTQSRLSSSKLESNTSVHHHKKTVHPVDNISSAETSTGQSRVRTRQKAKPTAPRIESDVASRNIEVIHVVDTNANSEDHLLTDMTSAADKNRKEETIDNATFEPSASPVY